MCERLRDSRLGRYLRSPRGPLTVAVVVAAVAIMLYMVTGLKSCQSGTASSGTVGGSLWGTDTTDTDDELGAILSQIDGAGPTQVLITYDRQGALVGVVVVSAGASDQAVAVRLMRAVQTATGADLDQIEIFEKKK